MCLEVFVATVCMYLRSPLIVLAGVALSGCSSQREHASFEHLAEAIDQGRKHVSFAQFRQLGFRKICVVNGLGFLDAAVEYDRLRPPGGLAGVSNQYRKHVVSSHEIGFAAVGPKGTWYKVFDQHELPCRRCRGGCYDLSSTDLHLVLVNEQPREYSLVTGGQDAGH